MGHRTRAQEVPSQDVGTDVAVVTPESWMEANIQNTLPLTTW